MAINQHNKAKLQARLSRASGHLAAVERMVADERYCIDVLHQLKAVQSALDGVSEEILKQHLRTCVVDAIKAQDEDRVMDELVSIFKKAPNLPFSKEELAAGEGVATTPERVTKQHGSSPCCSS